jgi:branched-chain amino acid transport system substrate-binding protein
MTVHVSRCLGLFVLLAVVLCAPAQGRAAPDPVIGIVHWESFAYATMMKNSYEMAAESVNRAGGILGKPVRLVYADDGGTRRGGETAVYELVKEKGAAILLGGCSSSNTLHTAMAANRMKTPFIVTTAADDRITQRKLSHVYRINPPAADYARGLEEFLLEKVSPKSMAILFENSPYGTGAAMQMMWFCRENEIDLVAVIPYLRERASGDYFDRVLWTMGGKSPDILYMVSYLNDAVHLVAKIREKGFKSLLCGGAGGFTHFRFIDRAGGGAEGLITAALWAPETGFAGARDYFERYRKRFGNPPDYHGAEAYSGLLVAAAALGQTSGAGAKSLLKALDRIDMATPFGPVRFVDFDGYQRQNRIETLVLQITGQQFRCIWPRRLSDGAFSPPGNWRR